MKTAVQTEKSLMTYEAGFLVGLAATIPEGGSAVNVGSGFGESSACILEGAKRLSDFLLWSIDIVECAAESEWLDELGLERANRFMQVVNSSEAFAAAALERMRENGRNGLADLIFLDGSHEYKEILSDLKMYGRLLKSGGILAVHDCGDARQPAVQRAVDRWRKLKSGGADWIEIGRVMYTVAFRKPGGDDLWHLGRLW